MGDLRDYRDERYLPSQLLTDGMFPMTMSVSMLSTSSLDSLDVNQETPGTYHWAIDGTIVPIWWGAW